MKLLITAILLCVGAIAPALARGRRQRARIRIVDQAVAAWSGTPPERRVQVFGERVRQAPDSCADLYFWGAALVHDRRISDAARAFGAAYHRDCDLESAALMTFACLKAGASSDVRESLPTLIERTWDEMRRPRLGRRPIERRVLGVLLPSATTETGEIELRHFIAAMIAGIR